MRWGIRYCIYSCKYISDRPTKRRQHLRDVRRYSYLLFLLYIESEKSSTTMQVDALPPFIFFWTINKLLRLFCSVKTDESNDALLHLSGHLTCICMSLRQVPIRSMQHVLSANKKRLVQGWKNAVAHSSRVTKNVECAKVLLPSIPQAYECCMAKLICVRY